MEKSKLETLHIGTRVKVPDEDKIGSIQLIDNTKMIPFVEVLFSNGKGGFTSHYELDKITIV